ncbi:hypothetical protein [Pseudomonas reactans]|uniref:hypothetical protein n=1 Tax=Pseudomonas reactans TaxID=117680 RepID=UPI0015A0FC64|nr:hypothetical protein [Pseudomonas reactans]NWC90514.1 hypothetical protein [Pseudomonas reactans]
MYLCQPVNKTAAICGLANGESLIIPCNDSSVQSTHNSIQSIYSKKGLNTAEYKQRKALLVFDENTLPMAVVVVTRTLAD